MDGEDLYSRLSNDSWDCIVLGRNRHYHGFGEYFEDLYLLVIDWVVPGVAERIGHVEFGHRLFIDQEALSSLPHDQAKYWGRGNTTTSAAT